MKSIKDYEEEVFGTAYKKECNFLSSKEEIVKSMNENRPDKLDTYMSYLNNVEKEMCDMSSYEGYKAKYEDMTEIIHSEIDAIQIQYLDGYQAKLDEVFDRVDALKQQIETDNKMKNDALRQLQDGKNEVYVMLEEKRALLEQYSDQIVDMCAQYGIMTGDTDMSIDMFSPEDLGDLYDEYMRFMSKDNHLGNPIKLFRETFEDRRFQLAVIGIILVVSLTYVFDLIGILIIASIVYGQLQQKKRMKYYTVLMGIVFNLRPLEYGWREIPEDELLPEEIDSDTDERFKCFEEEAESIFEEQEKNDPSIQNQKLLQEAELESDVIKVLIRKYTDDISLRADNIRRDLKSIHDDVSADFEKKKSELKLLGSTYNKSLVFDSNFRLGLHDDIFEEYVDVTRKNLIINPGVSSDTLYRFIRILWANAVLNVKPGLLVTYVFDPNEFGQVLIPFYTNDLDRLLYFKRDNLEEIIRELSDYCQQNMKDMRGKDIFEFNKECEELGKTPKEYRLLIVMSQPKTFEEQEALKEFLTYSSKYGVFVWLISPKLMLKNTLYFERPFSNVKNPYKIEEEKFCTMVNNTLTNGINSEKTPALLWSDFVDKAIPEKDIWTGCADEYIELYPGFEGGDPTRFKPYTVGNEGNVHIIGVGGTGAGKSVFLNHLIASTTRKYDPTEVELWLCDFKGTEFKFYLPSVEYPFMLPHIKACLCTSDGDYATSLFHAIRTMADKRYEDLKEAGQKNMVGYNRFLKQRYQETGDKSYLKKKWPRVLFICDEFQVIFEKADTKNLASITADITQLAKVARAAGIHIFFTSQSMKKTVSDDILQQFTLRFALRCDDDVSMAVLGTHNASSIREKNGFLYVRSVEMDLTQQKRYRTPFLNDSDKPGKPSGLRLHVKEMYDRANELEGFKFRDVITYEEATKHPLSELVEYYNQDEIREGLPEEGGLFFLGQRMAYSDNLAPMNVRLPRRNNSHIFAIFEDMNDFVNFYKTLFVNIRNNKSEYKAFINSQVADIHHLCEVEDYTDKTVAGLSNEKTSIYEVKDFLDVVCKARKDKGGYSSPMYVFLLGWDKAPGFGVDSDPVFRGEMLTLLQTCGELNMHIIFICNNKGGITQPIIDACNVKIAGRCNEDSSYLILNTKQASTVYDSMKNGYMFVNVRGEITRVKTYLADDNREIASDEFIIKSSN